MTKILLTKNFVNKKFFDQKFDDQKFFDQKFVYQKFVDQKYSLEKICQKFVIQKFVYKKYMSQKISAQIKLTPYKINIKMTQRQLFDKKYISAFRFAFTAKIAIINNILQTDLPTTLNWQGSHQIDLFLQVCYILISGLYCKTFYGKSTAVS